MDALHDTHAITFGQNGAAQRAFPIQGTADGLVALFVKLVRYTLPGSILPDLAEALRSDNPETVALACVLVFQTRDVRGGKGERRLFQTMFVKLTERYPRTAVSLVPLIPEYGRYKDLVDLWTCTTQRAGNARFDNLRAAIVAEYVRALDQDRTALNIRKMGSDGIAAVARTSKPISFAAKWLPSSKRSASSDPTPAHAFRRAVRDALFGSSSTASKDLRLLISSLNKELQVVEAQMSTGRWDQIDPSALPSGALQKYKRAMLYETSDRRTFRGTDEVRMALRERLLEAAEAGNVHAGTLDAHQLLRPLVAGDVSDSEADVINGQWADIVKSVREDMEAFAQQSRSDNTSSTLNLGNIVCMVDVSGSMMGTPMEVAISLGLLLSELAAPAFQNRVLTFHVRPQWFYTDQPTICEKVWDLRNAPWGGSTDFLAAWELILEALRESATAAGAWVEPPTFAVFSDMQFNCASGGSNWETTYETMTIKLHGLVAELRDENVLNIPETVEMPLMIFWNLDSNTTGLVTDVNYKGVILLSGYNQSMLKLILTGQLPDGSKSDVTPKDTFLAAMNDVRYDPVRKVLAQSTEHVLGQYEFPAAESDEGVPESDGDGVEECGGGAKKETETDVSEEVLVLTDV